MTDPNEFSEAERIFAEYLAAQERGESPDFEDVVARHADYAAQLRELKELFGQVEKFKQHAGVGPAGVSAQPNPAAAERLREAEQLRDRVMDTLGQRRTPSERLRIEEEIGRGGMGQILRVFDQDLRRKLALKVLHQPAGLPAAPVRFARFLEEAQVTAQLDHPGIVPVHELGLDGDGRIFFTMKLVKGRTLQEIFSLVRSDESNWNQARALGVILQVCQAMAYAHDKHVIHRDLKPSNIMVGRYGEVFVMDWGIARFLDERDGHDIRLTTQDPSALTQLFSERQDAASTPDSALYTMDGDVVGTPAYMPPEQAEARIDDVGPRSDVYSIGAMIYHLLAGHPPYCTKGKKPPPQQVWQAVLDGPPPPIEGLAASAPPELLAICQKAMARDPEDRYGSVSALADDLRAFLEGRVVGAFEGGAWAEFRKWVLRNRLAAGSSAAAMVAVIVGLVIAITTQNRVAHARELAADFYKLNYLVDLEQDLWPATPATVDAMAAWLADARATLAHRDFHLGRLADGDLDSQSSAEVLTMLAELDGSVGPDGKTGRDLIGRVEDRIAFARSLESLTLDHPEAPRSWEEAIQAIGDPDGPYNGLPIVPQLGLVPLGPDPDSGLWEFAHILTGEIPRRVDGKFQVTADMCVVLVLLPAGSFEMGTDKDEVILDSDGAQIEVPDNETPSHPVSLDAFFLSKYELTQGQWSRVRDNPAFFREGNTFPAGRGSYGLTHPVDSIDHAQAAAWLDDVDLQLPTEAQSEYGHRANTRTPWYTGADFLSLDRRVNLIDRFAKNNGGPPGWVYEEKLFDGETTTAPVGSYPPNPWGLHDVAGNVWEWTSDYFVGYDYAAAPGTGQRAPDPVNFPLPVARGGAFYNIATAVRAAYRFGIPGFAIAIGVRPARALDQADAD